MSKRLYQRLAITNLKKNKTTYFPFGLSIGIMVTMIYMLYSIYLKSAKEMFFGSRQMTIILYFALWVCGLFATAFIFYTNSFLIKRRTKELGLYSVLGLEKRHIGKILTWELFITFGVSIIIGLAAGILFSKLMFLALLYLIKLDTVFQFSISVQALGVTSILFIGIGVIILIFNYIKLFFLKPIDMLKSNNVGEREPKAKWLSALLGFGCLGIGYYIAITTENLIKVMDLLFLAVLLVIIGTYLLFSSGSIVILKLIKQNKKYYYQQNHFINVSGMMYRMKRNAAGLANICILSTAVLVILSSTVCLYIGTEEALRTRYTKEVQLTYLYDSAIQESKQLEHLEETIEKESQKYHVEIKDVQTYCEFTDFCNLEDGNLKGIANNEELMKNMDEMIYLAVYTAKDYEEFWGEKLEINLKKGEIAVRTNKPERFENSLVLGGSTYSIIDIQNQEMDSQMKDQLGQMGIDDLVIIVPETADLLEFSQLYGSEINSIAESGRLVEYNYTFDLEGTLEDKTAFCNNIQKSLNGSDLPALQLYENRYTSRQGFIEVYGGLLFIGIFIGSMFLMTTVLIIYYKQITEGFEDRDKFVILQKVGMSLQEVKKVIRSQVLSVFFLPLLLAVVHISFAFKIISKAMMLLNLSNTFLFILCCLGTILVFFAIYAIVYGLTARVYYKIIKA